MSRRIRLQKLMEENNLKSPDILTAVAYPKTNWEACRIAEIFIDSTDYELPFSFEGWKRTVKIPVELYFRFNHKKQLTKFVRQARKELPDILMII